MFQTLLIQPLYNGLLALYALTPGHDFGVAIILFTILVRLLLWPLIRKQLHSQRAMQSLAPEIAKVKQKAGGDRQKESQMLMEVYKEKGISPFASFVPLLIQLPLLFAFFIVIEHALKVGDITTLGYTWLKDLDYIKTILADNSLYKTVFMGIDMLKPSLVLAVAAGAAQFFQSKQLMPKKRVAGDQAAQMASTSLYIVPVITIIFGLRLPSALALYWVTTSLVAILQQYIILREDVEEMEESK